MVDAVQHATDSLVEAIRVKSVSDGALQYAMAFVPESVVAAAADGSEPFDDAAGSNNNLTITVTNTDADGVTVTVTDPKGNADDEDNEDLDASETSAPPSISGWRGSDHTRMTDDDGEPDEDGDNHEMVVVYTDIEPADDANYSDYYSTVTAASRTGVDSADDNGVLTLDTNADDVAAAAKEGLYYADNFPKAGDQIKTYATEDDSDTENVDESEESTFAGTFNGVPGKYMCTGTLCRATATADGMLSTLEGTWTFDPDADPTGKPWKVYGVIADADYLYFGYWVQTMPGEDGDPTTYKLQTFSGGSMPYTASAVDTIQGIGKYEGDAAGLYVWKQLRSDGSAQRVISGEFTADVNLTAYFGGGDVAVNKQQTIEGTVSGFDARSGTDNHVADLSSWTVMLENTGFDQANVFTGTTAGGGNNGAWTGGIFGSSELTPADDDGTATMQPSGVAGEFDAHFTNGHAVGGFGAELVED
jgi:hypothetical protein